MKQLRYLKIYINTHMHTHTHTDTQFLNFLKCVSSQVYEFVATYV